MIHPQFLHLLFSTASIDRWNDQIRPVDFMELDKQAHKMIIAWFLGQIKEEENRTAIDWPKLIGYGVSEFIYRSVVTDLKPPVFHHPGTLRQGRSPIFCLRASGTNGTARRRRYAAVRYSRPRPTRL